MRALQTLTCTLLLGTLIQIAGTNFCLAKGLVFGIVSKSLDAPNDNEVWKGCKYIANIHDDRCILIGKSGPPHPRAQVEAITQVLQTEKLDGLAISVTESMLLEQTLNTVNFPIISFDSPFDLSSKMISQGYVGMNNDEVGRNIAMIAKQFYPKGANVCLMTASRDPNLQKRILAIRRELSGNENFPANRKLSGENGWKEYSRSPWDTGGDLTRTMNEIDFTLNNITPDLLISTGDWPVVDSQRFRKTVQPYIKALKSNQTKIIIGGIGEIADIDTLLREHLIHGYVKANYYYMGVMSYQMMHALVEGKLFFPKAIYVPTLIRSIDFHENASNTPSPP